MRIGFIGLVVALVMVMAVPAMALNPNDCPDWFGPEWRCNGRVELSEMGEFDTAGNFVWNGSLGLAIQQWDSANTLDPYKVQEIKKGILQVRNYTNNTGKILTRLQTEIGEVTYAPVLWSVTCIDGNVCPDGQEAFFMDAVQPEGCTDNSPYMDNQNCINDWSGYAESGGNDCHNQPEYCGDENGVPMCTAWNDGNPNCNNGDPWQPCTNLGICRDVEPLWWNPNNPAMEADPTVDPCCKSWKSRMEQVAFVPVDASRVSVRWVNENLTVTMTEQPYIGKFPKYQLYPINFWMWPGIGQWSEGTDLLADYFIHPTTTGVHSFEISIDGVLQRTLTYDVTTLDPMPTVAATKEVEGDLKMKMRSKEIKSGLKITWNDPKFKEIQKPGIQLRVYLGTRGNGVYDRFFWIDCPAQAHKILIPMDQWNELKDALIADGADQVEIAVVYRTIDNDWWNNQRYPDMFPYNDAHGIFMNRGHSDPIVIPLN